MVYGALFLPLNLQVLLLVLLLVNARLLWWAYSTIRSSTAASILIRSQSSTWCCGCDKITIFCDEITVFSLGVAHVSAKQKYLVFYHVSRFCFDLFV
ncbi:uncharacterized protein LOC126653869 isoform X2 [Mercurialis annua]|uniref:uncharacterized protein LOC126653869 isoform X2 n=1 Tax=Mercurialis annua TaxID=3986 RepID=UPI00215EBD0C|nr:uncharacterized protein LOC126653869 isoform X2 [Mercurialis annua]